MGYLVRVRHKGRNWRVEIYKNGEEIGWVAIGCKEETVHKLVTKLILGYNPLPPKPPSLLAKEAIRLGETRFPIPSIRR